MPSCANSTVAMAVHQRMGYPRNKMVWVPNGVNAQRFASKSYGSEGTTRMLGIPAQALVVGSVETLPSRQRSSVLLQSRSPRASPAR